MAISNEARFKFQFRDKGAASPERDLQPPSLNEVEKYVLENLGRPPNFSSAKIVRITPNNFRVNVYAGASIDRKLCDSFFITTETGEFFSDPPIILKYGDRQNGR